MSWKASSQFHPPPPPPSSPLYLLFFPPLLLPVPQSSSSASTGSGNGQVWVSVCWPSRKLSFLGGGIRFMLTQQVTWLHRGVQQAPEPKQGTGCPGSGCATSEASGEKPCWASHLGLGAAFTPWWPGLWLALVPSPDVLCWSTVGLCPVWVRALPHRPCCHPWLWLPAPCSTARQGMGALGKGGADEVEMWHPLLSEISYPTAPLDTP